MAGVVASEPRNAIKKVKAKETKILKIFLAVIFLN